MTIANAIALSFFTALVGALIMNIYLMRTASGKAARAEIARQYGMNTMREVFGKPPIQFPEIIQIISPTFCEIYYQAKVTEEEGFTQICGLGYGKALEFLIKDYAIYLNSSDVDRIKKSSLSECISKYIPDQAIRDSSDLARWLRNDETHYLRKYESHDASDLRGLIDIAVLLIQQAQLKLDVENQIQKRREAMERDRKGKQ